jgi:hypothetical protein
MENTKEKQPLNSMREYFNKCQSSETNFLFKRENSLHTPKKPGNDITVQIEIIFKESEEFEDLDVEDVLQNENTRNDEEKFETYCYNLEMTKQIASFQIAKEKIKNTFLEKEINDKNFIIIQLKVKKNKISMDTILECFEYFLDPAKEFHFSKENIISYFYAFSICKLDEKRKEVLDKLLLDLSDENIIYFIKVVSSLNDEFLNTYTFWLLRHLTNIREGLPEISFNGYDYNGIVKISKGVEIYAEKEKIILKNKNLHLSANISFLKNFFRSIQPVEYDKYYKFNNYFNIGKVLRRKSDDRMLDDYPHYYQLVLENKPDLALYAMRSGENSDFILSRSIVNLYS